MILVSATGKVGSEAARLLAAQGQAVRLLTRHPDKSQALADGGVQVVEGDLDDPRTVDAAMDGVTSVVLTSSGVVPAHELNVIAAAERNRAVRHVVKVTSPASADSPIARQRSQAHVETCLVASGVGYTLLRSNFFMQNFLMLAPAIARTGFFGSCAGEGKLGMVDCRDVAAVAAAVAARPADHPGRTYLLTGPEFITYYDAANELSRVLGRTVEYREQTVEQDTRAMVAAGVPQPVAAMNAHAVSLIAQGAADWLSTDVADVLGRPARPFAIFANDYAFAFGTR